MKKHTILSFLLLPFFALISCGDDSGDSTDPQPTLLTFNLESATLNSNAIEPVPSYSLTVRFTEEGDPSSYSASGTANIKPTPGNSGVFSISGSQVTFSVNDISRTVSIVSGSLAPNASRVTLQWELTKIDDGVSAEEQGTYEYVMVVQ